MRLLYYLAAVICCVPVTIRAWNIFTFFSTKQENDQISLYPASPLEADPALLRNRRQAYQVYQGGDTSITMDKTGRVESGPWGPWSLEKECSKTCGGGVQMERRSCNGECTGPSTRYISCNIQECTGNVKDFRAIQCSEYDDTPLDGNYYKWLPYPGKNKCELTCKPDNANFYYKWADKVIDGTRCDHRTNDICVEGVCLPVGCDNKLGSAMKNDKCGKCGGDGSTCKTVEGYFDERNLSPGYHNIIRLPIGATSILVEELHSTTNSLAIKNTTDYYYLNGNYQIQLTDKDLEIGGTLFEYDTRKNLDHPFEKLTAKGPTTEELIIALLFQRGNRDGAIKYEFSVPLEDEIPYIYKLDQWSSCSVTCGKGIQTRTPYCIENTSGQRVSDDICDEHNVTKPISEKACETINCEAEWYKGEWEPCSASCGESGTQYRVIYCHQIFLDGKRITIDDDNCSTERPTVQRPCNRFSCPEWQAGPWSACSEKCGDAFQYRSVTCRSAKEGEEGKLLPAEACNNETMETQRNCNLGPCQGLNFITTQWKLCEKCNDTVESRNVTCEDINGRAYPLEKCLNENSTEIPIDVRPCSSPQPCNYEWHTSEWSKCSTECGHGHNSRRVVCAIHQLGDLAVVDDGHCNLKNKPEKIKNCTNEEKCNGTYYTGPWSKCSAECGGGTQYRMIVCLNYDKKPVPEWCDEAEKPPEEQECNVEACPTCDDSEFGCCPDNVTIATGPYLAGCSNCSSSMFGCCNDNITEAQSISREGCAEFVEIEGSGEESEQFVKSREDELCEVVNDETGEKAMIACGNDTIDNRSGTIDAIEKLLLDVEDLFFNGTYDNETKHCTQTEFGCCPDWTAIAEGKNNEGCPQFVLGACNETKFGCCPDEVTLARGSNYEGCGEPTCAASLYGCCKDRKTIAFGPYYAGCERSSFPCELSTYGCCPDGETAALGKNGTGCGENCLTTKFGCCPDGKTTAKGLENEGCGCEYAQYGCCPDGKTVAKGLKNYGCPISCAQSQYGCCPDGKTRAHGPNKEGCPCQYTQYGCCPDGETSALGPMNEGCDDCRYSKYGCCPDSEIRAIGPQYAGCPSTTPAPFIIGGSVAPEKIISCSLSQDQGTICHPGYKLLWYYDTAEGRCKQFWYGGCDGNENRFATKEQCEAVCVKPPATGRCFLPKVEGPLRCNQLSARYWYDYTTKQCGAFWWRGCLGNDNNFESWEDCQNFCADIGPIGKLNDALSQLKTKQINEIMTSVSPFEYKRFGASKELAEDDDTFISIERKTTMPREQSLPVFIPNDRQLGLSQEPLQVPLSQPQQSSSLSQKPLTIEEVCQSTADSGPCGNYEDMYYYDSFSGRCHLFIYGGCGGNLNRFKTREECEARCLHVGANRRHFGRTQSLPTAQRNELISVTLPKSGSFGIPIISRSRDACNERMDIGRCNGAFQSYYFERATGTCEPFRYSGCGGNANRFQTKEQCEELCVHRSSGAKSETLPPDSAFRHLIPISDSKTSHKSETISKCELPKDTGPCNRFVTKWYYNKNDGTCTRFHYGGCGGTDNRFDSEQQCKNACGNFTDPCELPKVNGPCSGRHKRYYFNSDTGRCERFEYGGCLGNTNNFLNLADCEAKCLLSEEHFNWENSLTTRLCSLPKISESCRSTVKRYYYDESLGECLPFFYDNCIGDENGFDNINDCIGNCTAHSNFQDFETNAISVDRRVNHFQKNIRHNVYGAVNLHVQNGNHLTSKFSIPEISSTKSIATTVTAVIEFDGTTPSLDGRFSKENDSEGKMIMIDTGEGIESFLSLPELCLLPEDAGPCFGEILRWRYNSETNHCETFIYTGCGHNANYFTSEEACLRACGEYRNSDVCMMKVDRGQCELGVTKWYYNMDTGQCHVFIYTGCGGNGNRFSSKAECQHLCTSEILFYTDNNEKDICQLDRESGPCTDPVTQWYFNASLSQCMQFTYGGCRGNANRFNSQKLCEQRCLQKNEMKVRIDRTKDDCLLPFEVGSCQNNQQRWYFDKSAGYCTKFMYSGCGGNQNRFFSEDECMHYCSVHLHKRRLKMSRPMLILIGYNPVPVGSTITLRCKANKQYPVQWHKNGVLFQISNNDQRIYMNDDHSELHITNIHQSDVANYSCSVSTNAILSNSIHLDIKDVEMIESCVDKGNQMTCKLITRIGLCSNPRYSSFCCHTCSLFLLSNKFT
ncbi:Kunitz/Bovine pancreatic trypsin inhibitor domain family protein [Acanthocheilonema viteae]